MQRHMIFICAAAIDVAMLLYRRCYAIRMIFFRIMPRCCFASYAMLVIDGIMLPFSLPCRCRLADISCRRYMLMPPCRLLISPLLSRCCCCRYRDTTLIFFICYFSLTMLLLMLILRHAVDSARLRATPCCWQRCYVSCCHARRVATPCRLL